MRTVGGLLRDAVGNDDLLRAARAITHLRRWSEVVGDQLASRSQPDRFTKGVVWVAVEGSAWAQELRLMKPTILSKLNEISHERGLFTDLRFGVRPIRPGALEVPDLVVAEAPDTDDGEYKALTIREIAQRRLEKMRQGAGD